MRPEHDPQVLAARLHLRPHLIADLDTVDMPEPTRKAVVEALLAAGDISRDTRPEIATVDGKPVPVLVHSATLTVRHPYPGIGERVWPEPGDVVDEANVFRQAAASWRYTAATPAEKTCLLRDPARMIQRQPARAAA